MALRRRLPSAALAVGLVVAVASCNGAGATPSHDLGPQGFSATGSMTVARAGHVAALLGDGRVLVAGGYSADHGASTALASAELFDPTSGTFSATASMSTPRASATANLLPDGRVLIAGGYRYDGSDATIALATAEIYDPANGSFAATGSLGRARYHHTATTLSDGRILIAGGMGDGSGLDSAEIYDPARGTFSATGAMTSARVGHTATILSDGRVLVTGGARAATKGQPGYLASAEIYDPTTATFAATGSMSAVRYNATALPISNAKVLIVGGESYGSGPVKQGLASAEVFDPSTAAFAATGTMTVGRAGPVAAPLPDGRALIAGGQCLITGGAQYPTSAEIYDPATGGFIGAGVLGSPRFGATTTTLNDGRLLIAGGANSDEVVSSAELYRP